MASSIPVMSKSTKRQTRARTLDLDTASRRIRETRRQAAPRTSPYFFICGAGVSVPSVPLAWAIEEECRERALRLGTSTGQAPTDAAGAYSHWLEQAYPDPDARRAYFRSKIEGQPVSDANLRLAHLVGSGALTNVVITPNFDDLLSRGMHLFGHRHVVCDHPATTARIDLDGSDAQIVHVHGTYWFYDLVNTDDEIEERAHGMRAGPGMGELLADLLRARVPLVVGYSGWEGDVVMRALRARLRHRLKHQLYWFLYSKQGRSTLPDWLTTHPNVTFVQSEDAPLSAVRVFDSLLRVFQVDAPPLTRDPLAFFADRLEAEVPEQADEGAPDLYYFRDVIARVRTAAESSTERKVGAALERVRDAIRRSRYDLAARYASKIELRGLSRKERGALADVLWSAVSRGGKDAQEDLRIAQVFLQVAEASGEHISRGRVAGGHIARVSALHRKGQYAKAAKAADAALTALDTQKMPRASHRLRRFRARALAAAKQCDAAIAAWQSLAHDFPLRRRENFLVDRAGAAREHAEFLLAQGDERDAERLLDLVADVLEPAITTAERSELGRVLVARAKVRVDPEAASADRERAETLLGHRVEP